MAALRRLWWVVVLGVLATVGMACSGPSASKAPKIGGGVSTGENSIAPTPDQTGGSSKVQSAGNGSKAGPATKGSPGQDGGLCKQCQSSKDTVKLKDADGYSFETGGAEAGRMQAGQQAPGSQKLATFDAGQGMTGTTGSSNLRPH